MRHNDTTYDTTDVDERDMTLALRDMFASIARSGATEDPLAVVCKSAVRCLPRIQFAYYCYKGEETGHVAAIREGISFFMPPPDVERQIVAMLRRMAVRDEVSVLQSKTTRVLLPPQDREQWKDYAGFALRVTDGVDADAAILAFFMPPDYTATSRHCVWMGLVADVASSYLARQRAFGKIKTQIQCRIADGSGKGDRLRFRDQGLEDWVESGMQDRRIKAIVGVRGSNKSSVLQAIRERVLASGVAENRVVTIDCEDASFRRFKTSSDVDEYLAKFPRTDETRYLFIDEIGMIDWHIDLLNRLQMIDGWNVWIAASTAHAISVGAKIKSGGLSVFRLWSDPKTPRSRVALEKYWCQIFMRDVVSGVDHTDIRAKEALAEYYSDHLGEVKSLQEISREMKPFGRRRISRSSISAYRKSLIDAYLIEISEVYDVFDMAVVSTISGRAFFTDLELRTWRYGSAPDRESTRMALNVLYLELRRRYDKVYTPRDGEADFVTLEQSGEVRFWKLPDDSLTDPAPFRLISRGAGEVPSRPARHKREPCDGLASSA